MIVHVPHGGCYMPSEYADFIGEPTPLTDVGARQVFEGGRGDCLVFPVDRLICDVERFLDGEPMEKRGMGVCYTHNARLEPMRVVTPEQREEIVRRFYEPHHERLRRMVDREVERYGRCLIVDGHSFSPVPLPYEDDLLRPEIDVGYDESEELGEGLAEFLGQWYDVARNRPFAGAIRPLGRIGDSQVASVMIELRQDIDMGEARPCVQAAMEWAERQWYAGVDAYWEDCEDASGASGRGMPAVRRHAALDALARTLGGREQQDAIYARWDDDTFSEDDERALRTVWER